MPKRAETKFLFNTEITTPSMVNFEIVVKIEKTLIFALNCSFLEHEIRFQEVKLKVEVQKVVSDFL